MGELKIENIKEIYMRLGDKVSKEIFQNQLLYSLTGDTSYIEQVVCSIKKGKELYERMKMEQESWGIFGAGDVGRHIVAVYKEIKFACFIDNKRAGTTYEGLPVVSLEEFKRIHPSSGIIISTKLYYKEILKQLLEEGYKEDKIINLGMEYEKLNHKQYFDLPILEEKRKQKEIFVDCGSYDGATSIDFINWCKKVDQEGYLYAWEPDPSNQEKCKKVFEKNNMEYQLIPKGLWSEKKELKLKMDGTGSVISEDGNIVVEVDSIDHLIKEEVTFIKMDIEGSEYQALLGARNIISTYKPKLAICIYHKPEDIWELPGLIQKIHPGYTFFLRHYSFADNETVLYAL